MLNHLRIDFNGKEIIINILTSVSVFLLECMFMYLFIYRLDLELITTLKFTILFPSLTNLIFFAPWFLSGKAYGFVNKLFYVTFITINLIAGAGFGIYLFIITF